MTSALRVRVVSASLMLLVACGGGDDDGGGGDGDDTADAEPACAPPVESYSTEVRAGKGTCDEDLLRDSGFLTLGDVKIDETSCGPFVVATYGLTDACDGTAELTVTLTANEPTDGRLDVIASSCGGDGGECTHAFPVDFIPEGVRP
jgi:hypothetical protein